MRKLHRGFESLIVVAAMALAAAVPAGALADGPSGETVTESPGASTEPVTPAPSTGWTPQGAGTETSGSGTAQVRHGSSLGSGGAPKQAAPSGEKQSGTTAEARGGPVAEPTAPTSVEPEIASSAYQEPSSPVPSAAAGHASTPPVEPATGSPEPSHAADQAAAGKAAVDAAARLTQAEAPPVAKGGSAPQAAAPPANPSGQEASGSGALLWIAIVCGLVLLYAGGRAALRWRRRARLQALWARRESEWDAAISEIRLERAPGVAKPSGQRSAAGGVAELVDTLQ